MTCGQALDLIQAFGDGELTGETQRLVHDHLRTCASCRRAYDERRQLVQSLAMALTGETAAPPGLAQSVWEKLSEGTVTGLRPIQRERVATRRRPLRIAVSLAGVAGVLLVATWMLFGRDLALARAIDQAMREVTSAHFTAVESGRKIEVWATPEAERVASTEGWMVTKGGSAYLFDPLGKRVTITQGPLAQLQLLRGLNVLMLSARVRGRIVGEPSLTKERVTLEDGRTVIRITASGTARIMGETSTFRGTMLVDPATNLILGGEITDTMEGTPIRGVGRRESGPITTTVKVETVAYGVEVPDGTFDTSIPSGWTVVRE